MASKNERFDNGAEVKELKAPRTADRDDGPKLPISVCINIEGNKLGSVRFSPEAAAKISRAEGFPHYALSREEKEDKLRKLIDYDYSRLIRRGIVKQVTHFNPLASCYFPHMSGVRGGGKRTQDELFTDKHDFPKAMGKHNKLRDRSQRELHEEMNLPNIFEHYLPPAVLTRSSVRKALRTFSGTQGVSNFSPVAAAAIYHRLLPEQGSVVFDPSCGWGGRLAGAIACDRVRKYIGCDPSTETFKGLEQMRAELVPLARPMGRNLEVELYKLGSETKEMRDALPERGVDAIFSSPPYFGQEEYSREPSQSYIQFPTPDAWLNGFMRTTLDNCAYCLKPDGTLAINIADVSGYPGNLEHDFLTLADSRGWKLVRTMKLALSVMPGTRRKQKGTHKYEPIFVFRKKP
jgi:DNA methylase